MVYNKQGVELEMEEGGETRVLHGLQQTWRVISRCAVMWWCLEIHGSVAVFRDT